MLWEYIIIYGNGIVIELIKTFVLKIISMSLKQTKLW